MIIKPLPRNPAEVITPPYDIISEQDQCNFYKQNPYNIIRLILLIRPYSFRHPSMVDEFVKSPNLGN